MEKVEMVLKKHGIPALRAKKFLELIKKQDIPIPEVEEILRFIELIKVLPKKEFEPTMKNLLRIVNFITENGSAVKTSLALKTNLNYVRLSSHLEWLEDKGLVESIISDQKVAIALTQKGRLFGSLVAGPPM